MIIAVPADEIVRRTPRRGVKAAEVLKSSDFKVFYEVNVRQTLAGSSLFTGRDMLFTEKCSAGFVGHGGS